MTNTVAKISPEIQDCMSKLLSTLDEGIFFNELSKFLKKSLSADKVVVYKVLNDQSCESIVSNNRVIIRKRAKLNKGEGVAGHVVRSKRAYFSNNVERDPIFATTNNEGIQSELCVPVAHEGLILATINFQRKDGETQFSPEDINTVLELLSDLKTPIANMHMFISAQLLNETLLKKIEDKEKELEEKSRTVKVSDAYIVSESELIGKSDAFKNIISLADRVAASDINFMIFGESGIGKEMMAKRIHCRGSRALGPFVSIDCSILSEDELDKKLFGHEVNDFINGSKVSVGLLEMANNGTLFIDKIADMPSGTQSKLLRFIKEGMSFRIDGQIPYKSDIRIIVATTKDIQTQVEGDLFREDLYYQMSKTILTIPSLKENRDDIEVLANHFLNKDRSIDEQKSFSPGAIKALTEYEWPGNVRELQSVIERSYILADGQIVEKAHLADCIIKQIAVEVVVEEEKELFQEVTLDELERVHICKTLEHLGGNKTKTAKTLGITVKTLYNKLHNYGMIAQKEA